MLVEDTKMYVIFGVLATFLTKNNVTQWKLGWFILDHVTKAIKSKVGFKKIPDFTSQGSF